jgi:hypothetical protein
MERPLCEHATSASAPHGENQVRRPGPDHGELTGQSLEQTAEGEVDETEHHRARLGGMELAILAEEAAAHAKFIGICKPLTWWFPEPTR